MGARSRSHPMTRPPGLHAHQHRASCWPPRGSVAAAADPRAAQGATPDSERRGTTVRVVLRQRMAPSGGQQLARCPPDHLLVAARNQPGATPDSRVPGSADRHRTRTWPRPSETCGRQLVVGGSDPPPNGRPTLHPLRAAVPRARAEPLRRVHRVHGPGRSPRQRGVRALRGGPWSGARHSTRPHSVTDPVPQVHQLDARTVAPRRAAGGDENEPHAVDPAGAPGTAEVPSPTRLRLHP